MHTLISDILLDCTVVFWDIYHEILRTAFLPKTVDDCFFLCQETWVYAKITALISFNIDSGNVQK